MRINTFKIGRLTYLLFILILSIFLFFYSKAFSSSSKDLKYEFKQNDVINKDNPKNTEIQNIFNNKKADETLTKNKSSEVISQNNDTVFTKTNDVHFWSEPTFYVAVLTVLVSSLIFLLGGKIVYDLWTKSIVNRLTSKVKQELLTQLTIPLQAQIAVSEVVYDVNIKAISKLTEYYKILWEWFSYSAGKGEISEEDKKIYSERLYRIFIKLRLGLSHLKLFSTSTEQVELAIREIQGISSIESIAPIRDFILLRRQLIEFKSLIELAEKVKLQIERIYEQKDMDK